jgi:hypothetical protein
MGDLQNSFAACFQPPREADGTRLTFIFRWIAMVEWLAANHGP